MAALGALITSDHVESDGTAENKIAVKNLKLSDKIDRRIVDFSTNHEDLILFLVNDLTQLDYLGKGGLKDKTNLGEFRYDVV